MATTERAGAVEAAAAEAIWRKDPFKTGDPDTWTGEGDQSHYREMATAALAAIDAEARSLTAPAPLQNEWGITWSRRWHALVPGRGGIRDEPATACGRHAYKLDGANVPERVRQAAEDPRTPVCTRCVAAVGPMPRSDAGHPVNTIEQLRRRVMAVLRVRDETAIASRNSPLWDATDIIETVLAFDRRHGEAARLRRALDDIEAGEVDANRGS
ncbi:Uncharacterised protein [Mycobacteroides abscessus subsp. massiliense]|nr:Uncharacterised protein [Mycobacteroides abscessus subsp. massiliense]